MERGRSTLAVWYNTSYVGELSSANGLWRFDYAAEWQASREAFDLAPGLPRTRGTIIDGADHRPVQWYFDNLLPEEGMRELLARDAGIERQNAFGLLEWYGAESAGALTLLVPGASPAPGQLQPLADEALSTRIRELPRTSLVARAPKRMSLAGAQHKLPVVLERGRLWEPVGQCASTHILKPDHPDTEHWPQTVANEWFVMHLARELGLPVPRVMRRHVPQSVYLVERFDRSIDHGFGKASRRHVIDTCQLLSLDKVFKYASAEPATLQKVIELCGRKAQTRMSLFRWLVFNLLVGNDDAHLKNLSFFATPAGYELAPFYDLLSTVVYRQPPGDWAASALTWPIGAARSFSEVERSDVVTLGLEIGLPVRLGERIINEVASRIVTKADEVIHQATYSDEPLSAGEARLLRQIRYMIVAPMVERLMSA